MEELDPLLRDLKEKKKSFQKGVVSLVSELKDVRRRLAQAEDSFARESLTRQAAESRAKSLEEDVSQLQRCLENRDELLRVSASAVEKYQTELEVLKSQLQATQAAAEESCASAQSANVQCSLLLKELDVKNKSLKEQEELVNKFMEQLSFLQKELDARVSSQEQLKDVMRIEKEIMLALKKTGSKKNSELRKLLALISPRTSDNTGNNVSAKDEEIVLLRDELRKISAFWKLKTRELELKLEKYHREDEELRKWVLKLEFCLQEARAQTRKLQQIDERRDQTIKDLQEQLEIMQQQSKDVCLGKQNFWESAAFKIFASMSMLVLVAFAKR